MAILFLLFFVRFDKYPPLATGDNCFQRVCGLPPVKQTDFYCVESEKCPFNGLMKATESINIVKSTGGSRSTRIYQQIYTLLSLTVID